MIIVNSPPKNLKKVQFKHKDGKYYSLNVLMYKDELENITNKNDKVFKNNKIKVFFPIDGIYYGKVVKSSDGFTIKDIVKAVQRVGIRAVKHVFKADKPEEILAQYGLYLLWIGDGELYAEAKKD